MYGEDYLAQKLPEHKREQIRRIATEPSWLERAAVIAWRPVRPVLRGMGHGLVFSGRGLLRVTENARANGQSFSSLAHE